MGFNSSKILASARNDGVASKTNLKMQELALNWNKLTDTSGIHHRSLERLELNHNDIRTVALDPQVLVRLRTLELRGNALVSTAGKTREDKVKSVIYLPRLTVCRR